MENLDNNNIGILTDKGRISAAKRASLHKTAGNHFKKFLSFEQSPYRSLEEIPEEFVVDSLLGRFSDYLSKQVKTVKKYNTHDNYVSAIHVQIVERFPAKQQLFAAYYTRLRDNIFDEFKQIEADSGLPFANNAKCMRPRDRDYICQTLFVENNHELRAKFTSCKISSLKIFIAVCEIGRL